MSIVHRSKKGAANATASPLLGPWYVVRNIKIVTLKGETQQMAEEYEEVEQDEFAQTGAGWWIRLIGIIVYILVIVAYALQTLELVNWLFPGDNWFMKVVTVFVCDGCATGYAMAEMFYRFRLLRAKHLTFGMWIVTFVLSTAATVIQMYLSSTHNVPHAVDPTIISVAYGLIILAFVVNIIAITVIIRMEHGASQPQRRYLDEGPKKRKIVPHPQPVRTPAAQPQQLPQVAAQAQAQYAQFLAWQQAQSQAQHRPALEQQEQEPQTGPFAMPDLETTKASQNGHSKH